MSRTTTSLRLDDQLKAQLGDAASKKGLTVSALIERYIREGLVMQNHPDILFTDGPSGRRATLISGPDVWEVAMSIPRMTGTERERIQALAKEFALPERMIISAINYVTDFPEEIEERLRSNERAGEMVERRTQARKRLFA
jgi:hypothetical protein